MSIINKPNTFSPNTSISSSQVNSNFDTLYNDYNGSISAANLASNSVTTAKIADGAVTAEKLASGVVQSGWIATLGTHSVSTGYNSGNRSFEIDTSTDLSGIVSPGMRYKVNRSVAPPDQCADLEASSSQYASKSSPIGTGVSTTISAEAWIKPESYVAGCIVSHYSSYGWTFYMAANGQITIVADDNVGTADSLISFQSVPLDKWTHVAFSLTLNSGGAIYINGVSVPLTYNNGTCTTIQENGNLEVGAFAGSNFFDGKLSDVRVWSDIRTATEIQDNMFAYPADTTNLVAHFKLDGDFTDSSTNGNDLTASGGAVATNADNPWNATEYGVITAVTSSTIQVFCPEGYGIPNETLTSPFYSTQDTPYGFPKGKNKWILSTISLQDLSTTSTSPVDSGLAITLPIGIWDASLKAQLRIVQSATSSIRVGRFYVSGLPEETTGELFLSTATSGVSGDGSGGFMFTSAPITTSSQITGTAYYFTSSSSTLEINGATYGATVIRARCAYI